MCACFIIVSLFYNGGGGGGGFSSLFSGVVALILREINCLVKIVFL